MLRKAVQFHQFSTKLLQIRMAEAYARIFAPSRIFSNPGLPRDIVIRVTEKCFLKCKFCGQGGESGRIDRQELKAGPVEPETFHRIIDESAKWPIKPFIKITGGEPLVLGDHLLDSIQEMRDRRFVVKLNTNGMLLKHHKIARRVAETDLNYLSISIDGKKEVHNELRGNPRLFDSIMEGIDNVKQYCRELGKKNLMILVSMVVSSDTQDQIEEVYQIALNKNIDWFNIQFINYTTPETCSKAHEYAKEHFGINETPWSGFCNPRFNEIDSDLVKKQIDKIMDRKESVPISVMGGMSDREEIRRYYFTLDPIRKNICYLPFTGMHVIPPGKAVFCIDYPFFEYGDLREDSIRSVWYGVKAKEFRKALVEYYRNSGLNFPQCQRCNWRFN
jgi:MoaA/NifB/PqqE/SkfB family radical SAM enzyme